MEPFRDDDLLDSESNSNEECLSNAAAEHVTIDPETQSKRCMPDHDKIAQECMEGSYSKDREPAKLLAQSCHGGRALQSLRTLYGARPCLSMPEILCSAMSEEDLPEIDVKGVESGLCSQNQSECGAEIRGVRVFLLG